MPTAAWEGHATISLSISDPSPDGNQEIIYTRGAGPHFSTQSELNTLRKLKKKKKDIPTHIWILVSLPGYIAAHRISVLWGFHLSRIH